jgi:hypothetical protein
MYTVVLMMALTGGEATPACHPRGCAIPVTCACAVPVTSCFPAPVTISCPAPVTCGCAVIDSGCFAPRRCGLFGRFFHRRATCGCAEVISGCAIPADCGTPIGDGCTPIVISEAVQPAPSAPGPEAVPGPKPLPEKPKKIEGLVEPKPK